MTEGKMPNGQHEESLADRAEKALRDAGRIPERKVLDMLPDSELERVIAFWEVQQR